MRTYKKYVTIDDPKKLVLSDLPFQHGQRVEIVMIAEDVEREKRIQELRTLLKRTQALPKARAITDDMIAEELAAYRAGR
jgi:antitoxin ParD1/3/4